jgi:hypothetical protein
MSLPSMSDAVIPGYVYRIGDSEPFSIFSVYNLVGTLGCVFWFLAYGFIIFQSHKDKASGVPLLALCLNFGWEFLGSFVWENPIPLWRWFYRIWFVLDIAIFVQMWLYGRRLARVPEVRRHFHAVLLATLLAGTVGQWAFTRTFHDPMGFITAFAINLVMSVLFIGLYFERRGRQGLSFAAAWFKLLGTLCTSIECHYFLPVIHPDKESFAFPHFLYASILLLDGVYIGLLWRARRTARRPSAADALSAARPPRSDEVGLAAALTHASER